MTLITGGGIRGGGRYFRLGEAKLKKGHLPKGAILDANRFSTYFASRGRREEVKRPI